MRGRPGRRHFAGALIVALLGIGASAAPAESLRPAAATATARALAPTVGPSGECDPALIVASLGKATSAALTGGSGSAFRVTCRGLVRILVRAREVAGPSGRKPAYESFATIAEAFARPIGGGRIAVTLNAQGAGLRRSASAAQASVTVYAIARVRPDQAATIREAVQILDLHPAPVLVVPAPPRSPPAAIPGPVRVPASIPADCSRDVVPDLNSFLATVPDASTVQFPADGCYRGAASIFVKDHRDLVIDGNGSTFTITAQGNDKAAIPGYNKTGGNWVLLRGSNITLENMHAVGSFPLAASQRSLALESQQPGYADYMSNYGVYGTNGAHLQRLSGSSPWGDVVTAGPDTYVDNSVPSRYPSDVHVEGVQAVNASRTCFALTSGTNLWLVDSSCQTGWVGGTDEEVDSRDQPLNGLHILNDSWKDFGQFAIEVPVPGPNVANVEVRGNTIAPGTIGNGCGPAILVGGYPNDADTISNVIIDANRIASANGTVIQIDHVAGGEIRGNQITPMPPLACGPGPGVGAPLVAITNSSNVTAAENALVPPLAVPVP